ncbi:MAG: NAD-dependent epimerase/dehydratase family protein [Chloroflexota bacterium]
MKVLVTGGAGFIGSHVVDLYLDHGLDVVVVDDLSSGRLSNLNPRATFYRLDIRSPDLARVFEVERPQVVNHHAARIDVRRSMDDPLSDADVNILGSVNLLACSRAYGVRRFIYISSGGAVYGEPEYLPCDEVHPVAPISAYGASKLAVEHYLHVFSVNYGLETVVLRYPNVYGPRQDPSGEAGVVTIFVRRMLTGEPMIINGDGEQERDFVYVSDCARANLLALTRDHVRGIYNLGSGRGTTINALAVMLQRITGDDGRCRYGPARSAETRCIYLNAGKARREMGWEALVSLEEGLRLTVEHQRTAELAVG